MSLVELVGRHECQSLRFGQILATPGGIFFGFTVRTSGLPTSSECFRFHEWFWLQQGEKLPFLLSRVFFFCRETLGPDRTP